jgi:hypothetical protein
MKSAASEARACEQQQPDARHQKQQAGLHRTVALQPASRRNGQRGDREELRDDPTRQRGVRYPEVVRQQRRREGGVVAAEGKCGEGGKRRRHERAPDRARDAKARAKRHVAEPGKRVGHRLRQERHAPCDERQQHQVNDESRAQRRRRVLRQQPGQQRPDGNAGEIRGGCEGARAGLVGDEFGDPRRGRRGRDTDRKAAQRACQEKPRRGGCAQKQQRRNRA